MQPFGSALYVYDEVETTYTFYFSPSEGITTLEAMWQADDYLRIITALPSGDIDLTAAGNELVYKDITVSASTAGNIVSSSLQLRLPRELKFRKDRFRQRNQLKRFRKLLRRTMKNICPKKIFRVQRMNL